MRECGRLVITKLLLNSVASYLHIDCGARYRWTDLIGSVHTACVVGLAANSTLSTRLCIPMGESYEREEDEDD